MVAAARDPRRRSSIAAATAFAAAAFRRHSVGSRRRRPVADSVRLRVVLSGRDGVRYSGVGSGAHPH